ncbi:MAG: ACT domain-containing protein [Thermoplasmata archaeon]
MWKAISKYFSKYPSQAKVARLLLRNGFSVRDERIFAGDVELADTAIARAAGVDRRVVRSAVFTISQDKQLSKFFSKLLPTNYFKDVAPVMGWSAIEIISNDAHQPGILASVSNIISEAGISVRQAIVDDPETTEEPRIFIITESTVPPELIPRLRSAKGVKSITIY